MLTFLSRVLGGLVKVSFDRQGRFAPVSRKVVAQALANVIVFAAGLALARLGLHANATTSAEVAAGAALLAGLGAGWLAKSYPKLVGNGVQAAKVTPPVSPAP